MSMIKNGPEPLLVTNSAAEIQFTVSPSDVVVWPHLQPCASFHCHSARLNESTVGITRL